MFLFDFVEAGYSTVYELATAEHCDESYKQHSETLGPPTKSESATNF